MDIKKDKTSSLLRQGLNLVGENKFQEAKTLFTQICDADPLQVEAWYYLSSINGHEGDLSAAEECCRRALNIDPNHGESLVNLGNILFSQGKIDDAIIEYKKALKIDPNHAEAHCNIGNLLALDGKFDEALASYQTAIKLNPKLFFAFYGLGNLRIKQERYDNAANCYGRAIQLDNQNAHAHYKFGVALTKLGKAHDALSSFREAIRLKPDLVEAYEKIGDILFHQDDHGEVGLSFDHDNWFGVILLRYFSLNDVEHKSIAGVTIDYLLHKYNIPRRGELDDDFVLAIGDEIASDKVFLAFLEKTLNTDDRLELLLTKLRRSLLINYRLDNAINSDKLRVVSALAHQGVNNEYVFFSDNEEDRQVADLRRAIEQLAPSLTQPNYELECKLLIYGMYDWLCSLSCRSYLSDIPVTAWSEIIIPFMERALTDPLEEEKIKQQILSIGTIESETSLLVQSQYEENPYPRWISIAESKGVNIGSQLKSKFNHFIPPSFLSGPIKILVAGCGTGKQAIQAAKYYDNVQVSAIDISKSSLAYAIRMADKLGVKNIQFMQGDILELENLNEEFHVIICTGVLHHMKDPLAGWDVLTKLAVKNGLLKIALYSERARKQIVAAREVIKKEQVTPTRENIRKFRFKILNNEMGELLSHNLNFNDFYSLSMCRDLLFHFVEHRFTLLQIDKMLRSSDFEFLGFDFPAKPQYEDIAKQYLTAFPSDPNMRNLALWDQFEAAHPDTFASMFDFWCQNGN